MSNITVIDNFLDHHDFNELQHLMTRNNFPWYYNNHVIYDENLLSKGYFQFTHLFYKDNCSWSNYIDVANKIVDKINPLSLIRIKANLLVQSETFIEHGMHTDYDDERVTTAVFYVNTNNGYTLFDNGEKVSSIENRIAIFPATMKHTGSTCTDKQIRVVINFNYLTR